MDSSIRRGDWQAFLSALDDYVPEPGDGHNALHDAVLRGRTRMAVKLIERMPGLTLGTEPPYGNTPVMYAIWAGDAEVVSATAAWCPRAFEKRNEEGDYPLHVAAKVSLPLTRLVWECSPDVVSRKNFDGETPLHSAASYGGSDACEFLYDKFPLAVRELDARGQTPLHLYGKYATGVRGHASAIRFLFDVYPEAALLKNKAGELPVHLFSMKKHAPPMVIRDIAYMVRKYPEIVETPNASDMVPTNVAAFFHNVSVFEVLAETCPASAFRKNKHDKDAIDYFYTATGKDRLRAYLRVMTSCTPGGEFWDRVAGPCLGAERHIRDIYEYSPENASTALDVLCSRRARDALRASLMSLSIYTSHRRFEKDLVRRIAFASVTPSPERESARRPARTSSIPGL